MEHQLFFTRILNQLFGPVVAQLLLALHIHPESMTAPITNAFAMEVLVVLGLLVWFLAVRSSLSVEKPGGVQHLAEFCDSFINDLGDQVIGHGYERFMPFVGALFMFILISNLLGLVPGFEAPTASPVVPLGFAIATFFYYNYHGVREQGAWGYFKHFLGPMIGLAWFIGPLEIFSNLIRVLSLTVRLYANMFAGDLVTLAFYSLIPIGVPIIFLTLHLLVSVVQAFVFMLLCMIYLAGAVSHDAEAH